MAEPSDLTRCKADAVRAAVALARGLAVPAWPLELFVEVNTTCNLRCVMCATRSALSPEGELFRQSGRALDPATVEGFLGAALPHALSLHCFGHGEPTVHPRLREVVSLVARHRVMLELTTNGMSLPEELAGFLVEQRVQRVTFSLSGVTRQDYEDVYVGGRWEEVLAAVDRLVRRRAAGGTGYPVVAVNSLAFRHQVESFDAFVAMLADRGVDIVQLTRVSLHGHPAALRDFAVRLPPDVEREVLDRAREVGSRRGVLVDATTLEAAPAEPPWAPAEAGPPLSRLRLLAERLEPAPRPASARQPAALDPDEADEVATRHALWVLPPASDSPCCLEPFKTLSVQLDGQVKPCCSAPVLAPGLGDLRRSPLARVWRGAGFGATRAAILAGEYPMRLCGDCLRSGTAAPPHHLDTLVAGFLQWYQRCWGEQLLAEPDPADLGASNREVARRLGGGRPTDADPLSRLLDELDRSPAAEAPLVEGRLEGVYAGRVTGWVRAPWYPELRLPVTVYLDGVPVVRARAALARPDVAAASGHDGRCGFSVVLGAEPPRSGAVVRVRVGDTGCEIPGSPLVV